MFPPIELSVYQKNPQFTELHKIITSSILKPDGSSLKRPSDAAERTLREELNEAQKEFTKLKILKSSLAQIDVDVDQLPNELRDVIEILSGLLTVRLDEQSQVLVEDQVQAFLDSQDLIGPAVSQQLRQSLADVSAVAKPLISSRSSNKNRSLPEALEAERGQVAVLYEELTDRRLELTKTACEVLDAFGNLFDTIIRTLEQTKHGSMARNVKAQADHLAVAAESTEAKLRLTKHDAMSAIYTPEVKEALIRYEEHLRDTDARLQQRAKTAEEILARYASMGGDEVKDIVKRYGEVTKDIEMTRADIKRLGGEV